MDSTEAVNGAQVTIPGQRDATALERGAAALADWLDTHDDAEHGLGEPDQQCLWHISELALGGASDAELSDAVRAARAAGWNWPPIALLLAESPPQTRQRMR